MNSPETPDPVELKVSLDSLPEGLVESADDPVQLLALRYYRSLLNVSQSRLAREIGAGKTSLKRWEEGQYMGGEYLDRLCTRLGIRRSRFWLVGEKLHQLYLEGVEDRAAGDRTHVAAFEARLEALTASERHAVLARARELGGASDAGTEAVPNDDDVE